ncbi:carbamoyl-phosphate synthase arginine-specific large chain [Fusarium austroafricanum]|uniref:Carbamoyl phosphate synthase arginine-specific large chain, mitochondrial n=1 Tax=Fusarium austroafricanum TaxID=2364996 RepID=A0A8H4KPH3_9HYPO|nr:carbamoyl-phosphate synthase arginine-specific large chain [Fusarium austroafricanum]
MESPSTLIEFMMILCWACLSETPYHSKNILFARFLTSLQVMAEIAEEASLTFAPGLSDVVQSALPTIEFFKSLPSASLSQWGIYVVVLRKPGCRPKLYIGSGTAQAGVHARLNQYSQNCHYMLPSGATLLDHSPSALVPLNRLFFLALEATFAFMFWAMGPQKEYHGMDNVCLWDRASLEYDGICTHCSLAERVTGDFDLTAEELEAQDAERKKRYRELHNTNNTNTNWHFKQMAENYDDYITRANERSLRARANNPERTLANEAKRRAIAIEEKKYYCKECDIPYTSKQWLVEHYKTDKHARKLVDSDNPFFCRLCNIGFENMGNQRRHNASVSHRRIMTELAALQEEDPESVPYDLEPYTKTQTPLPKVVDPPYFCRPCDKGFTERGNFFRHKKAATHHKKVTAALEANADTVYHVYRYFCPPCNREFHDLDTFDQHKRRAAHRNNVAAVAAAAADQEVGCDRLYFDELSYERVMDIYELENSKGVVVSVGGQLPQNIALRLQETGGAKVLGTDPRDIDKAEDRQKFSEILDSIGVDQPAWKELTSVKAAEEFAAEVGYPVLVRPSYVLSGAAMTVISSQEDLKDKLEAASNVSPDHPVVITKFIEGAQEIDVDGVSANGELILHAVSEHVEQAGVHSGDATLVLPPANLDSTTMSRVKEIAEKVAAAWKISGPFNMQIIKAENPEGGEPLLKVIECNLRASRSFPFVSKVLGTNFIDAATKALVGKNVPAKTDPMAEKRDYIATKVPQFSWTRLAGADPFLGVEMASTGEIACFGKDLVEAYWTSLQSTMNFRMPEPGEGLLFGGNVSKPWLTQVVDYVAPLGYKLFAASPEVKQFIETNSKTKVEVEVIEFPKEDKRALREVFKKYDIRGCFNLAQARGKTTLDVDYVMRRNAVDFGVPLFMEPQTAILFAQCMSEKLPRPDGIPTEVRRWSNFIGGKPL